MIGRLILSVLIGVGVALWTWTAPGDPTLRPREGEAGVTLQLLDNGFHTDLAVSRAQLVARGGPLAQAAAVLPPGDWILIGWGDAKFYVDQSPISDRLPDGARAFFRPGNPSVVMLDPYQGDPVRDFDGEAHAVHLSRRGFDRLAARVEASLDLTTGAPHVAAARPGDDARFFASRETFSILHLCNHWTAQVLNAGGVAVRPARSITSAEVVRAVEAAALDTEGARD